MHALRMKMKYVICEWAGMELPVVLSSYLSQGDVSFNHSANRTQHQDFGISV